jgi:aminopeptidase N
MQTDYIRQAEAQSRGRWFSLDVDSAHSYDQIALSLDYRVEDALVPMTGHAYLTLVGRSAMSQISLDAHAMTISQVSEHGSPLPFSLSNDTLYVTRTVQPNDTVTLDIEVSVPARTNSYGLNYATARAHHAYTFAEPYGARWWFPCFDQPFDKFNEVTTAVNMPDNWNLASNGALIETTYPSSGRKRQVYHHSHPISTYLVVVTAGDYTRRYETVNNVEFRYFAFPVDSANAAYDWGRTPLMVQVYDSLFGPYPFEQYGMAEAAFGGGMEHQTFTTIDQNWITGNRAAEGGVAHELSHQWFGDHLTCVDFRNIWLNEGFATYCASLFYEATGSEALFDTLMSNSERYYFYEDRNVLRYAIYNPPPQVLFGTVEYDKGGWVLHMLRRQVLGDSLFFAGMRHYVAVHGGGTVNTEDFIQAMNDVSGQDLHWFFDQWVYHAGHPAIEYTIQTGSPASRDVSVFVHQTQYNPSTQTPYFRFPLMLNVHLTSGQTVTRPYWFNAQEFQTVTDSFPADVQSADLLPFQDVLFEGTPVNVPSFPPVTADRFELGAVYPNPFNSVARIPYELARTGNVKIEIYDVLGRLVQTLRPGTVAAGRHEAVYTATPGMASGVYLIALESSGSRRVTKALFLK